MTHICKLAPARKVASYFVRTALPLGVALALMPLAAPSAAFAADTTSLQVGTSALLSQSSDSQSNASDASDASDALSRAAATMADAIEEQTSANVEAFQASLDTTVNKVLAYDPADIEAIGNQTQSGHSICCPSYACAYADAVLDGTVNDHSYYTCSCCTWTDWGGGDSSYRCVGTDEDVLREAYDQIAVGKPTVVHVSWEGGEHWIALIGYQNAYDPDHLTLDNFIALNPSDGAEIVAGSMYALYGDGCQHISDR